MKGFRKNQDDDENYSSIPSIPETCGVMGCESGEGRTKGKTAFVMMKVASGNGIQHRIASEVTNTSFVGGKRIMNMNDGYVFQSWFTRCHKCLADGVRNKKARMKHQGEHHYYC